ncbi:GNAT family N-acetyltransferase [Neptuniibacter sp. QD34_54]|uniref:GNAT family N-acetyltransferase n=1 Tax=Neptuniibacter sp. QD34_54 TaxID=3398208 RepID=UPI0039F59F51
MYLRKATKEDVWMLFEWANDEEVRKQAFNSDPIEISEHHNWFKRALASASIEIYIALLNEIPVGQIRFTLSNDNSAEVDIHTAPSKRGLGYGVSILKLGIEKIYKDTHVEIIKSMVKVDNNRSLNTFLKLGFNNKGIKAHNGINCFYLTYEKI